jgi:hypothetical protein
LCVTCLVFEVHFLGPECFLFPVLFAGPRCTVLKGRISTRSQSHIFCCIYMSPLSFSRIACGLVSLITMTLPMNGRFSISPLTTGHVKFQNSNLLHLPVKCDNVGLTEALLQNNANINAFCRGKTPWMGALKCSSAAVRELLLNRRDLDINIQNQAREIALWYTHTYTHTHTHTLLRPGG